VSLKTNRNGNLPSRAVPQPCNSNLMWVGPCGGMAIAVLHRIGSMECAPEPPQHVQGVKRSAIRGSIGCRPLAPVIVGRAIVANSTAITWLAAISHRVVRIYRAGVLSTSTSASHGRNGGEQDGQRPASSGVLVITYCWEPAVRRNLCHLAILCCVGQQKLTGSYPVAIDSSAAPSHRRRLSDFAEPL